jgi:hypothetical protein
MTGIFPTPSKERFCDVIITNVIYVVGPTKNGIDRILVTWSYITKNTMSRAATTQKAT